MSPQGALNWRLASLNCYTWLGQILYLIFFYQFFFSVNVQTQELKLILYTVMKTFPNQLLLKLFNFSMYFVKMKLFLVLADSHSWLSLSSVFNFHLARCSRLDSYISVLYCIRQEQLSFSDSSLFFVSYFIESKISSRRKFLKIKVSPGKIWVKDNWTKQNKDERNKVMKCLSNMTVFFNLCSSRNVQ